MLPQVEICHLYISAGHNFVGHHGREPDSYPMIEVPMIECVTGRGIRGDRYFDFKDDYKGQITFFSLEVFDDLCGTLGSQDCSPALVRRNVMTRDVDLNELIGQNFEVQGVRFYGTQECRPCYWMDHAVAPGAEEFLKGRGGLRAKILSDGELRSNRSRPRGSWMNLSAVLLAGGESRRMGTDKARIIFRGKPLWKIQLALLRKLDPLEVFVSARIDPDWRPDDVQFVADNPPSRGPLSGLAAALAKMHSTHLLALAIDMPFMSESYLRFLWQKNEPGRGVLPKIDSRVEPLAAIYPREVDVDFHNALSGADFSLQTLTSRLVKTGKLRSIAVSKAETKLFINLNKPADVQSA